MKKVARLRVTQQDEAANAGGSDHVGVRTTGRIKKPKAVFDPSDNYLSRAQRASIIATHGTGSAASATAAAASSSTLIDRSKRDTSSSTTPQPTQGGQDNKRLSQSSVTSATSTSTTSAGGTTPETATPEVVCDVCQKPQAKRGTHARNKLITCLECERRIHKLCLPVDFEDIDILRQNYRCENCRTCEVCDEFADCEPKINQPMVTCSKCIKSYHLTCHIPNVFKYQQIFRWKCNKCSPVLNSSGTDLPVKTIREIIGDEPKRQQQQQQSEQQESQQQQKKPEEQQQKQQHQQNVNIAAAAEEAKSAAAAAKRALQKDVQQGNENGKNKISNGGGGRTETETPSYMDSGASTSSTSGTGSSSSTTSSSNTSGSIEGKVADEAPVAKKQKSNTDEAASNSINNNTNTHVHTPIIRYSPYEPIDVPDVKDWNVDQVASYFAKYFPNEAHVFKDHEIDGTSLLLLKRSDVIKKLPIKLGPSLRIYSLILKIQTQLNDPTLGWNCGL